MENNFGLMHVWQVGDWVIRSVALILLAMSVASWFVIATKWLNLRRLKAQGQQSQRFWSQTTPEAALNAVRHAGPYAALAQSGHTASEHLRQHAQQASSQSLSPSEWVSTSLQQTLDECSARLQTSMVVLASVGSTAPFVGLFGTVWGIYHALLGIGAAGQASIDQVAGPIGEALIMTALGLAVAIPAVLAYNGLLRAHKGAMHQLNRFAHDLHAYLLTGARVQSRMAGA
jgi:biopolymer transport protein ExbB